MEDRTLLSTFTVRNTADSGPGSLRQAILDSNAASAAINRIDFDIPGPGEPTIAPASPLPAITHPVLIDGFSQPGYAGTPLIEIDGSQAGGGDGLTVTGLDVTIRGLDITHFSQGAGIHITGPGATRDWISGNFLGTDPTGTQATPNNAGVEIDGGASGNLIGSDGDGVNDAAERDLVGGNLFAGIWINGPGTTDNVVAGNFIGTDVSGTVALNNGTQPITDSQGDIFGGGVVISSGASGNRIGTDGTSVDDAGERNIIAGSSNDGIDIYGDGTTGNVVAGNFIGTDATGTQALGIAGDGVFVAEGASSNWIGVNPYGGPAVADEGNLISGNGFCGVQLASGCDGNVIAGNKIGTDVTGTVALGNPVGVEVDSGSTNNTIGGTTAGAGDVISGNAQSGVAIFDMGTTGNLVQGNEIGTDITGSIALGNGQSGVLISGDASWNTIGGTTAAAGNLITDNGGPGVVVGSGAGDTTTHGNQITANRIFFNTGQAIDLGDDGVTSNSSAPRRGANDFQNFPILVTTAGGQLQGRLAGSASEMTFRIDVFASAAYNADGSGEAEDYLGSLEVTTDGQGQVRFDIPFAAPAGLPILTATATDPQGNTSEVTALRRATLQAPTGPIRVVPDQPSILATASGEGIAIRDPDAGPLDPAYNLTLSVGAGTLTLPSTSGLTGSGNGTGSLAYSGPLSAIDAALKGLSPTTRLRGPTS
jgi:hypothetical protein